jgi:hypothetical protein
LKSTSSRRQKPTSVLRIMARPRRPTQPNGQTSSITPRSLRRGFCGTS